MGKKDITNNRVELDIQNRLNGGSLQFESIKMWLDYYRDKWNINELNMGIYYFFFEEYLNHSLSTFDNEISKKMTVPLFKLNDKKLSILEVEKQMINSKGNYVEVRLKAKKYLENEITDVYKDKWFHLNELCEKINGMNYLSLYNYYFNGIMENLYYYKNEILKKIKKNMNEPIENSHLNIKTILDDILKVSEELEINHYHFKTMNIKENANKFSMYTDGVTRNIEIELTSNKDPFFVHKTWHELGHALHYLNMDQDLNYIFKKIHNTSNMEFIAVLFQLISNEYYNLKTTKNIYQMMWWSFVEFFSIYEFLNNIEQEYNDINKIVADNLDLLFNNRPIIPGSIRYFKKSFKSFKYIIGFFCALGFYNYCKHKFGSLINQNTGRELLRIMRQGGAYNNNYYYNLGLSEFLGINIKNYE